MARSTEWDRARIVVTGLEPRAIPTRVRVFGSDEKDFTLPHRAYSAHNKAVRKKAGKDADFQDKQVVLRHNIAFEMNFKRKGDEFAPQLDPIRGRDVSFDPAFDYDAPHLEVRLDPTGRAYPQVACRQNLPPHAAVDARGARQHWPAPEAAVATK